MKLRIMQYSLSIRDFIVSTIGIFITLLGFAYIGPFRFIGMIFLFLFLALTARIAAHWFMWDGPFSFSKGSIIIALGCLVVGIILFLV